MGHGLLEHGPKGRVPGPARDAPDPGPITDHGE
jgi:hypothetical protein